MSKRPNKMGRIGADPKPSRWEKIKVLAHNAVVVLIPVALIALGIWGTLQYQSTIASIKAQGVAEFTEASCEKFTDKDNEQSWLECDL